MLLFPSLTKIDSPTQKNASNPMPKLNTSDLQRDSYYQIISQFVIDTETVRF